MSSQTTGGETKQTMDEWLNTQFNAPTESASDDKSNADPVVETPPAEAAPAAEQTPQAPPAPEGAKVPGWKLKLKEDGSEHDLDLEEYARDDAKRAELVAWLQKGRQHEKVVERRLREQQQQTSDWLLAQMKQAGYDLVYDEKTGRLMVNPFKPAQPNTTAAVQNGTPQAATSVQTPDLTDPYQIRQRIAALRPKMLDGDAEAFAEVVELQDKLAEAVAAAKTKPLMEHFERLKQSEAQQHAETFRNTVRARVDAAFKRHEATFAGLDENQRTIIAQGIAQSLGPNATIEALEAGIDAWAQNEAKRITSRLQSAATPPSNGNGQQRAPAPAAPPVHGGRPPAAGGGSNQSSMPKSSFEAGWADRLIP